MKLNLLYKKLRNKLIPKKSKTNADKEADEEAEAERLHWELMQNLQYHVPDRGPNTNLDYYGQINRAQ